MRGDPQYPVGHHARRELRRRWPRQARDIAAMTNSPARMRHAGQLSFQNLVGVGIPYIDPVETPTWTNETCVPAFGDDESN
jgi:hypothetical protein